MKSITSIVVFFVIVAVAIFHKYIPIRDMQFWIVLPLVWASASFYFDFMYDVFEGKFDESRHMCAAAMIPIWLCLSISFYNAGKIPHAVITCILMFACLNLYLATMFLRHPRKSMA